jgi:hypothetical protein
LEFDLEPDRYARDLASWLDEHLSGGQVARGNDRGTHQA